MYPDVYPDLFLVPQFLDRLADHARLGCLKHADHFPSAFNSSPVLPPCLRRRSLDHFDAVEPFRGIVVPLFIKPNRGASPGVGLDHFPVQQVK